MQSRPKEAFFPSGAVLRIYSSNVSPDFRLIGISRFSGRRRTISASALALIFRRVSFPSDHSKSNSNPPYARSPLALPCNRARRKRFSLGRGVFRYLQFKCFAGFQFNRDQPLLRQAQNGLRVRTRSNCQARQLAFQPFEIEFQSRHARVLRSPRRAIAPEGSVSPSGAVFVFTFQILRRISVRSESSGFPAGAEQFAHPRLL